MDLKILSWNVEHFNGAKGGVKAGRVARVIELLEAEAPDVFGLLEVEGGEAFYRIARAMPGYSFLLTEGNQVQEILIGYRRELRVFMTQKGEFKENNIYLRPAALLTLTTDAGRDVPILFAHFKSSPAPEGFGLRAAMFEKAVALKKALDRLAAREGHGSAPFVMLGDMNTMGLNLKDSPDDIDMAAEIARCDRRLARVGMRRLAKSHPHTFSDGARRRYADADLDHIYVDAGVGIAAAGAHEATVGGWAQLPEGVVRHDWIASMSDHAPVWVRLTGL